MGERSRLFLNQDTSGAGLLRGGLQDNVTLSPVLTVMFVGCCTKLQSISANTARWSLKGQTFVDRFVKDMLLTLSQTVGDTVPAGRRKAGCDLTVSF